MDNAHRRLAGILAADVVGYSTMVGQDEPGTLARVRTLRTDLLEPVAATYGGRLFKTTGDGFLAAFASAVQALRCAIAIQERLNAVPDGLRLRIGVHQGEVVEEGDDLLGDGVIIAARLEPLAAPGGICISARVREDAAGKMALEVDDLGTPELKGIVGKIQVLRVRLSTVERPALPLPDKPSIAVLAFTNMSGDPEQEYFSDGIADDIITELSRSRSLFVIARNSSFTYRGRAVDIRQVARELGVRYVLEGSVRRSGSRVRIVAQLIDAETGTHVWAERYESSLEDVFAVQDEITGAVVAAIHPALTAAEQRRALRKAPESLGAWEAYQRGFWHLLKFKLDEMPRAREFFACAIELDPTLAAAYTGTALLYLVESHWFASRSHAEAAVLAAEQARKAIDMDPGDAEAHGVLASALFSSGDFKEAATHAQQALSINPSCALANYTKGAILLHSGQPAKARADLLLARQLDPRALDAIVSAQIGISYYFEDDYDNAVQVLRALISARPNHPWAHRWLAAALAQLGRMNEAQAELGKAITTAPDVFDIFVLNRPPWIRLEDHEHMLDGLRKAGWQG
jgi:adenylate cyclase